LPVSRVEFERRVSGAQGRGMILQGAQSYLWIRKNISTTRGWPNLLNLNMGMEIKADGALNSVTICLLLVLWKEWMVLEMYSYLRFHYVVLRHSIVYS